MQDGYDKREPVMASTPSDRPSWPDAGGAAAAPGASWTTSSSSPAWGEPAPAYPEGAEPTAAPPTKSRWKRWLGPVIAIGALLLKFGAKLKFLLLLLPKIKLFTTSASMLVSIGAYALIWGWSFAVGFVLLLLVHEMGHVFQLRREGIKASAPLFIPFLGAAVAMKQMPKDAAAEARVGLAGPILGSLGCLIPWALYAITGNELFQALAFVGFFLNLFNLLPVLPLDGGRAMAALTPWMWLVGFAMLIGAAVLFPNPIMLIILLFGGMETWRRWKARKTEEGKRYHEVRPRDRVLVGVTYVGLAVALAVGMDLTFVARSFSSL